MLPPLCVDHVHCKRELLLIKLTNEIKNKTKKATKLICECLKRELSLYACDQNEIYIKLKE